MVRGQARSRRQLIHLLLVLAVMGIPAVLSTASGSAATGPPGCSADRSAAAFYSDGSAAPPGPAPVPCASTTGFGGAESAVQVAPNGSVVEEPAILAPGLLGTGAIGDAPGPRYEIAYTNTSGLAVSQNKGTSWQLVEPAGNRFACCDAALYIDRRTGRLFYSAIFGAAPPPLNQTAPAAASQLMSSPASSAGYVRWTAPTTMHGFISENPRFTSAPAPAVQPPAVPGEDMAYWCGNAGPGRDVRICYRSFDGGASWQYSSILYSYPVPQHRECGSNGEGDAANGGGRSYPQGASDGSLWVMVACGGSTYLARSTDEATTWPIIHKAGGTPLTIPGTPEELRVDSAGNLYILELDGPSLTLRVSTDGGLGWSGPFNMTAPAARHGSIFQWQVAVGYQPGQVAVSYFASRPNGGYDGYITVTHDARDTNPVFYAATINPPNVPLMTSQSAGDDWIYADIGPDGTPWASFYSDCLKAPSGNYTDASCVQDQGQWIGGQGPAHAETVGHLLFP